MYKGSVTEEAREVLRAIELIQLGARMPVLEKELTLSRNRLIRLYRELKNASPPKGMLPFSADWYFTWLPNIHASLFYNIFLFFRDQAKCSRLDSLTRAYRLKSVPCAICATGSGAAVLPIVSRASFSAALFHSSNISTVKRDWSLSISFAQV